MAACVLFGPNIIIQGYNVYDPGFVDDCCTVDTVQVCNGADCGICKVGQAAIGARPDIIGATTAGGRCPTVNWYLTSASVLLSGARSIRIIYWNCLCLRSLLTNFTALSGKKLVFQIG